MPFTTPPNFVTGQVVTEAELDNLSNNLTFLANPPTCRVFNSAAISIPNGASTVLTFNSEHFDTDTMHSTATDPSRITITTAGRYMFDGNVSFAANATGTRGILFRVNGTTTIKSMFVLAASTGTDLSLSGGPFALAAGAYVEMLVFQNSGAALNVEAVGSYSPEFAALWVSL